ncbi:MAG: trehalose-phosphatase [Sphingomonas fennica]
MTDAPPLTAPPAGLLDGASLFLDFDGTLVELADRPDAVAVDARLRMLIAGLDRLLDGRIAIVSGRSVAQIRAFFEEDVGFSISGSHGLEIAWADGRTDVPAPPEWLAESVADMEALAARYPGVIVEPKTFGAALHYRQAPQAGEACHALAETIAGRYGIALQPGKMMIETRLSGADKGAALTRFMEDPRMAATRPIFIGDDVTDESAFAAAAAHGGAGILVGPARATAASYRLDDVAAVLSWLGAEAAVAA